MTGNGTHPPNFACIYFSDASKYCVEKKQYCFILFFSQRVNMPNSCLLMDYHFATNKDMYEKCVPGLLSGCKAN